MVRLNVITKFLPKGSSKFNEINQKYLFQEDSNNKDYINKLEEEQNRITEEYNKLIEEMEMKEN